MSPNLQANVQETMLQLRRTFAAPRDRAFRAWTDPALLKQWWGPANCSAPLVEIDLRVGGRYRFGMQCDGGRIFYLSGVYRQIEPPEKLVFTWRWESPDMDAGETLVTVEFIERGPATEIALTHQGFPAQPITHQHHQGWTGSFDALAATIERKEAE